ncbi:MerR family transcriptional regulator [Clostridium swellfunianum]|uniref:MerR family transcriptional regulator n=1 Tax=Clostridium swellfunianum TaxID=1367462 RepID=UPI0020300BF1|nr:MerR family transcriptional regulator [Clostridium swellfunianum]MCM0650338.1 MerR family transcriptional regulator [Clostridium swellfunianum]
MLIKDICEQCKVTKKAVEYYEQQGLISPRIMENAYRSYSEEDVNKLKEISVLRKLNISVTDIKKIIESTNKEAAIDKYKYKMELELERSRVRMQCLEQLGKGYDIRKAEEYIDKKIHKQFTIKEKLLYAFPGSYGMYLCVHFGRFLDETADTEEKQEAYNKIVAYLDSIKKIEFPGELEKYLVDNLVITKQADMEKINSSLVDVVNNMDSYLEENKEVIDKYLSFRNSEEFKNSAAYKLQQLLLQFQKSNGYYETFIANLKILSDSYREYCKRLESANKIFMEKYPKAKDMYR